MVANSGKMTNSYWKGKRVFITGYKGFIGSHLVKALEKHKAKVYGTSFPPHKQYLKYYWKAKKISHVFHLGAQVEVGYAIKNPHETFTKNVEGTFDILEACKKSNVERLITASTDKVYGEGLHKKETDILNGLYPYDVSKVCADYLARSYIKTYNMNIAITRCCNIYGGGDMNFSRLIPYAILQALQDRNIELRSNGLSERQYMFIDDAIFAYLMLGESEERGAFNFGYGKTFSVMDIVKQILLLMPDSNSKINILDNTKSEISKQSINSEKAIAMGWKPTVSLNEGLIKTILWYQKWQKS